jgi:hypothetical protein
VSERDLGEQYRDRVTAERVLTEEDQTKIAAMLRELPVINLDGFDPKFGEAEYSWGPAVTAKGGLVADTEWHWQDHQYHVEFLSWHYHDYLGTHAYVQVWDYAQQDDPDQRWQYMLLLHRPTRHTNDDGAIVNSTWAWTIRMEYEPLAEQRAPSHAQVGADIDVWLQAPDFLRFIVE